MQENLFNLHTESSWGAVDSENNPPAGPLLSDHPAEQNKRGKVEIMKF